MNIHEFCDKFNTSLAKARKMDKCGVLRLDSSVTALDEIRHSLARAVPLNAAQLVELIDTPGAALELGKYAAKAEEQLAGLGRPQDEVASKEVTAYVLEASEGKPEAVEALIRWIKTILPSRPVRHAYIATRLLLGIPPNIRKFDVPRIPRALLNCRRHPDFAGWWRIEKRVSRTVSLYEKKSFDL